MRALDEKLCKVVLKPATFSDRGIVGLTDVRQRRRMELCSCSSKGAGKRGGLRVIYFVRYQPNEFWMLALYAKAKQQNVPAHILKQQKEAFET